MVSGAGDPDARASLLLSAARISSDLLYSYVALLLDNASCHKIKEPKSNVQIVFLPPKTTSVLQALDQGIILQVNMLARKAMLHFLIEKEPEFESVDKCLKEVTVYHAIKFVSAAWSLVTADTIQRCFSATGVNALASDEWNTDPIVDPIDFEEICKDLPPAVRATLGEFNQSHLRNAIKIFFLT